MEGEVINSQARNKSEWIKVVFFLLALALSVFACLQSN
jgi:uncharacterized membrane protein